jgi:cellulose synthase/poly-beta-1,6-N-acetylglucosamine synthase-like glycosyltransferase
MNVTLVCGTNYQATSKLCAMLGSIGFNGYAPFFESSADRRFNTFVSQRLAELMSKNSNFSALDAAGYVHVKSFSEDVERFAETLKKKRIYLYHPQLYRLIPFLKYVFDIRVIFVFDSLIEPDSELKDELWQSYYDSRADYRASVISLIENQNFPYLCLNTNDFFQNKILILKRIINFHQLKAGDDANIFNVLQKESNQLAQRVSKRENPLKKVSIVTAYAKESTNTLLKCINSVKNQSVECVHILVADGFPNASIAQLCNENLLHISLPENIGFNQCGIGVELAFALGFDVVGILDADNWYEPDHIKTSLDTINNKNADVVFAKRKVVFPDGEVLAVDDPQDNTGAFADTNCLVLTDKVSAITPIWLMWPKTFGAGEDRAVSICTRMLNFNVLMNAHETVWYQTNWAHHYRLQKKQPVAPLRKPATEFARSFDQRKFFESTGYNLPIKQANNIAEIEKTDFSIVGIVAPISNNNPQLNNLQQLGSKHHVLIVHHADFSKSDIAGVKTLRLPKHESFQHTAWSLGASLMFQTGCEVLVLLDSETHLDKVDFHAMLNLCKQSSLDVILQSGKVDGILKLKYVLVTKKAKFFAAIWNQLNHISSECRIEACQSYLNQKNIRHMHLKENIPC